jgi:hypothetical protein
MVLIGKVFAKTYLLLRFFSVLVFMYMFLSKNKTNFQVSFKDEKKNKLQSSKIVEYFPFCFSLILFACALAFEKFTISKLEMPAFKV